METTVCLFWKLFPCKFGGPRSPVPQVLKPFVNQFYWVLCLSVNVTHSFTIFGVYINIINSPSDERGSRPHWVRLQSKELKEEETRNREDGQKNIINVINVEDNLVKKIPILVLHGSYKSASIAP